MILFQVLLSRITLFISNKIHLLQFFLKELSSPERRRSHELAGPSGQQHSLASVSAYGELVSHNHLTEPIPDSGLPAIGRYPHQRFVDGLYRKVNDHLFVPIDHDFHAIKDGGFVYGAIFDRHIRPLYNARGNMIIVNEITNEKHVIEEDIADMLGLNRPYSPPSSPVRNSANNSRNSENNSRNSENNSRNSENNSINSANSSRNSRNSRNSKRRNNWHRLKRT